MNEKKKNMGKGDFIELDKDQYKKKSNYKVYLFIIFIIIVCFITGLFFLKKSDFFLEYFQFTKQENINNRLFSDQNEVQLQERESFTQEIKSIDNSLNQNQIDFEENLKEFKEDIDKNKNNLEETQMNLGKVEKKLSIFIDQYKLNSDYYYSEKYLILNALLRIKSKFKNRKNFDEELNLLDEKFQSNFEIQNLIDSLQKVDINKILKKRDLLEILNKKIKYFDQNLESFIVERIAQQNELNIDIFSSKENFLNYLNDFISSIVKISKIENNTFSNENNISLETQLRRYLVEAKEYLLYDDIQKSVEKIKAAGFDDKEIRQWINDMESLQNATKNFDKLEFFLLELTGKEID